MLINVLPLFLANVLGVRTSVIGLIEGVAETTASLVKLTSGALSDRLGRARLMLVGWLLYSLIYLVQRGGSLSGVYYVNIDGTRLA